MRRLLPLHPERLLSLAAVLAMLILQTSCASEREIRASIDGSNEKEGGDSELDNNWDPGWNVAMCFLMGMPGTHQNSAGSDASKENTAPWALSGQIEVIQKGSKLDATKTTLSYVNAIGDVLYQYPIKDKGVLYGGLGPYIGYGFAGHVKGSGFKEPAFGSDGYKRLDGGVHLTAGYRLPVGLSFNLAYEWGLLNKSRFDDFTSKNRTFSFQLGYSLEKIISGLRKK